MSIGKRILFISFLALPLLAALPAHAQMPDYHVRAFDQKDGVNSSKIVDMVHGEDGFLWLLYRDQIIRFDGIKAKKFPLADHFVSIKKGQNGEIWANSLTKLYRFKNDRAGFLPVLVDTTGNPQMISMIELPRKKWRLLTNRGFYKYDPTEKKFLLGKKLTINDGEYILKYSYGLFGNTFFYASNDSIVSLDLKTGETKRLYVYDLYRFHAVDEHSAIVSNWKGQAFLYDFFTMSVSPLHYQAKENNAFLGVMGICPLENGNYLLASYNHGLMEYNAKTKRLRPVDLFLDGKPFANFRLTCLYQDERQNIWVATDGGLVVFNPEKPGIGLFRNWIEDPSKSFSEQIRNFAMDDKGNLWLATLNGFAKLDLKTGKITPFKPTLGATDRLNHPSVRGLVFDGRYLIIGQSNRGIWLYDPETKKYKRPQNTPILKTDDFIDQIYTLDSGDQVVIAREEVWVMDGETYRIEAIDYPGGDGNPAFCYQDVQGRIWISAGRKLYCFDAEMHFLFEVGKTWEEYVFSMCQWAENEFFLGSKGLYKLTLKNEQQQVEKINAFPGNINITILYKDRNDKIWMGTDKGIFSYDVETGNLEKYGYFHNVQPGRFYLNSWYRIPNGPLFMGGIAGLNYFSPEKMQGHSDPLRVSLLRVNVNGKGVGYYPDIKGLELDHSQKDLELIFSAPNFQNPHQVVYRYKLNTSEGDKWVFNGKSNRVRFYSLPPGDYSIQVAASINGEDWYENPKPLSVSISPPFWKTWWFICLLILLGATLIYLWVRHLQKRIRAEEILNRFATSLFGQNTVEDTFWDVAQNCIYLLGFEDCVIYRYDEEKQTLVQIAAAGPKGDPIKHKVYGAIEIPLGKGIVGTVAKTQRPEIVKNTRRDPRYIMDDQKRLSEISVPIIVDGKTYGVIDSEHSKKGFYTKWHLRMLEKTARLCSEKISKYLVAEGIRTKIAQDLHDDMGSTLTSINIISKIAMDQGNGDEKVQNHLKKIKTHSGQMMESMDDIIWAINPEHDSMEEIGLHMKEYASELLDDAGTDYSFRLGKNIEKTRFDLSTRKELFLIFKEAMNNAVKYSKATKIGISMKKQSNTFVLSIKDNGLGFDTEACSKGNGLKNMRARAEAIQGNLQIESAEGKGTAILLKMPIT